MSITTAKKILEKEFKLYALSATPKERLAIELFGGEPLTNFALIKKIYEWTINYKPPFNYIFQITTNGTLLNEPIKQWLKEHKDKFRLVLSVDGTEAMQTRNRGCKLAKLPISFVKEVWPNSYFKLTLSHETLPYYAEGVISLYEQGYCIASSLAEGQKWKDGDVEMYRKGLIEIGEYFIEHPNKQLEHPFNFLFKTYLNNDKRHNSVAQNCGCGTTIAMYDIDGTRYPCHLFLPMVHGNKNVLSDLKNVDFSNPNHLINQECINCNIKEVCKTCYGYNYLQRGDIKNRDKNMCNLRLVEAQVISAFQIKYLTLKKDLSDYELLMLKAALMCYQSIKNVTI